VEDSAKKKKRTKRRRGSNSPIKPKQIAQSNQTRTADKKAGMSGSVRLWTPDPVKSPRSVGEVVGTGVAEGRGIVYPIVMLKSKADEKFW
jgi:hypothetical protein